MDMKERLEKVDRELQDRFGDNGPSRFFRSPGRVDDLLVRLLRCYGPCAGGILACVPSLTTLPLRWAFSFLSVFLHRGGLS